MPDNNPRVAAAGPRERWFQPAAAAIGLAAGVLNGLIGIGGGIVMVPGLMLRRGLGVRQAVATSLGAVVFLSSLAFALHVSLTGFAFTAAGAAMVIAAGIAGAQAGGWLLNRLPRRWVILTFAALTLFTASRLVMVGLGWAQAPLAGGGAPPWWGYPLFGSISGLLSGLLGIGGGAFVVLAFSVFFHTPVQGALPIALALNVTNALSGVWAQRRSGNIRWSEVGRLVPAALAGIVAGTALAVALPPNAMRLLFGGFFLVMAGRLIRQALRT